MKTNTCSLCRRTPSILAELHTYNGRCEECTTETSGTIEEGYEEHRTTNNDTLDRVADLSRRNGVVSQACGGGSRILRDMRPSTIKTQSRLTRSRIDTKGRFRQHTKLAAADETVIA